MRSSSIAPFVGFLDTVGAPVGRLLGQARVPESLLYEPEALIPLSAAYRFVELAARKERIDDVAVAVGSRASSFDLGAYGVALRQTSTIYEYLAAGIRLIGQHNSGLRFWLRREGDAVRIAQHMIGPPGPGRCIGDLYTLVLAINMLRAFIGPSWQPGEVRLLAGDEKWLGAHDVFGDAAVIPGQRYTSFTLSRELLGRPMPGPRTAASAGEDSPRVAVPSMPTDFRASAEELILALLSDGYPPIGAVAEAAAMSPRTLQRRLSEVGVTYKGLIAASRLRLARDWLAGSDRPIADIAEGLGYVEASNFTRAFRRETGVTPAAYRRSLRHA